MFPSIDEDVLSQILAAHNNDAEAAALALLDADVRTESEGDEDIARKLQLEQDEEVAKSVHESLQREIKAEADVRKQQEFPAVASRALSSAAQKFLHGVSKPKQRETSTHAAP